MDRQEIVTDLVEFRKPIEHTLAALREFPWDSDEELATLDVSALRRVVDMFERGRIDADELEEWADAVEGRDDIAFGSQDVIDAVNTLANPVLFGPLTKENVNRIVSEIEVSS
ncbi:hypothetical protein [Saccharomonospora iraqiensis]|uniref:hypothetical protein n=1 Tax=Saccharomonospora iraqiensis TaxID=52698 RepID=UPI00022E207C|nr:hypothetical protein [Saccharomonospora iraqiensis]